VDGFFIVDKPAGVTSFSVVALVRRLTGIRRVGHAGTLDPLASGVLPVAVGHATRLIEYTDGEPKAYLARVRFGVETDTEDAEGTVTAESDATGLSAGAIAAALPPFVGLIEQVPPRYSALKLAGKPLYRYAREGADVEPAARRVRVDRIELVSFDNVVAEIAVVCGKGTYIRSIARDLGRAVGTGAHLAGLVRTRSAGFTLADANAPDELRTAAEAGRLGDLLLAPDRAVERRPAAILGGDRERAVRWGRDVRIEAAPTPAGGEHCRAYDLHGRFLGMLEHRSGTLWHPAKVVETRDPGPDGGEFS
jgi:tRNA pseudouridine55 synthase